MRLISRAAAILRALADHGDGLSLGQIATETGLVRATVQRIVGALEVEGFVTTNPLTPGVSLGAELARIAGSAHRDVIGMCRPHMKILNKHVNDTIDLTILQGSTAVVVEQIHAPHTLKVVTHVGTPLPLHCTASGKAHLSRLSVEQCKTLLTMPLRNYTSQTLSDANAVIASLHSAPEDLIFRDVEEYSEGVCAIAAPIRGIITGNYALSILQTRQRYDAQSGDAERLLLECRDAIERAAGL
ncbi:IclR family transcriptional regulator [Acetobacter sacchari]|uniref:IclR family transcriptional regulator n=1 Tax=Acetobacter sacchari TaxID=2661687 RepID=A0ABS3LW21_9PROT|nr:IclR family transcriptional regulator [Acetobacter sacchari]MBO1360109.1 IclR family transcriptional regulator [Acetobacter sacchari]